jgi:tetratricopeptide (TPR) repeat protein
MLELKNENVDIRVLTSIGNCHRKLKTFEKGIPFFEAALDKETQNFYALFGLADCYRGMNCPEKALEYWNKILEQDPRNKMILTRAGDAYRSLEDYDNAKVFYDKALNIESDTYAVLGLAMVAKAKGKFEEAVLSLKRLIQQDTGNYRLYIELADHYLSNKDKHSAIETLVEFQRLGNRNQQVSEMLEKLQ